MAGEPADLQLGLTDHVEQVVHPPGGHPDGLAAARAEAVTVGVLVDPRQLGDHDRGLTGTGGLQGRDDRRQVLGADRAVCAGHRPGDALGGDEEHVDEVLARGHPPVPQRPEQVLGEVSHLDDGVQAQHPGRPLDGVRVPEQARDELLGRRGVLEPEQPLAQRGQPVVDLGPERRNQLGVVGPLVHSETRGRPAIS